MVMPDIRQNKRQKRNRKQNASKWNTAPEWQRFADVCMPVPMVGVGFLVRFWIFVRVSRYCYVFILLRQLIAGLFWSFLLRGCSKISGEYGNEKNGYDELKDSGLMS